MAVRRRKGRRFFDQNGKTTGSLGGYVGGFGRFTVAMAWLHYQQLCSPGGGTDPIHPIWGSIWLCAKGNGLFHHFLAHWSGLCVGGALGHCVAVGVVPSGSGCGVCLRSAGGTASAAASGPAVDQSGGVFCTGCVDAPRRILVSGNDY